MKEKMIRPRLYGEGWEDIISHVRKNGIDVALQQLKGVGYESLSSIDSEIPDEPTAVELDLTARKYKTKWKDIKKKYESLLSSYEGLSTLHSESLLIRRDKGAVPIEPEHTDANRESVAVSIWSDWHVGEKVSKSLTFGLNEYNKDIARDRSQTLTRNLLSLVKGFTTSHNPITELVIYLLGDYINGFIHEENTETNTMTPIEEVVHASDLLIDAIDYQLQHGDYRQITLCCSCGNHGRNTRYMRYSNQVQTNYETLIYNNIARAFRNEPRIKIVFPESDIGYHDIYGIRTRFYHGHQVKLGTGLTRIQSKWDALITSDLNFMGHFHTLSYPNHNTVLNGSLVGYNAFAATHGFSYQPAQQFFGVIDSYRGFTIRCPVFCEY